MEETNAVVGDRDTGDGTSAGNAVTNHQRRTLSTLLAMIDYYVTPAQYSTTLAHCHRRPDMLRSSAQEENARMY